MAEREQKMYYTIKEILGMGYKVPKLRCIPNAGKTKKLYKAEEEIINAIEHASEEYGKLRAEITCSAFFYRVALPAELLVTLDSFDRKASILAAKAFLETERFELREK